MFKQVIPALVAMLLAFSALAASPLTIDASSAQSAQASYERMFDALPTGQRVELQKAIILINMDGVGSAAEMLQDPELRNPGIKKIRARVAGMTAQQIIAEARKVKSVRIVPGPNR